MTVLRRVARIVWLAVPLSPTGIALLALAAGLLAAGIARADLAGLFWGSSFLLVELYFLAASQACRLLIRRKRASTPGFLSVLLPPAGLYPGDPATARLSVQLPRSFPPGFSVRFSLPLRWHARRLDSVAARLAPGRNERAIPFTAGARGAFRSVHAVLEIRDALGVTSNLLPVPVSESMTVFPSLASADRLARAMEEGGEATEYTRRRRRSEELLETRKYYPGDDVRRLNWKIFAHINELFLRVGEETPPPESRVLFLLDASANPLVPRALADEYLDGLVESCASAAAALLAGGVDLLYSGPGAGGCRSYTTESRVELLAALADAWWTGPGWTPELPGRRHLHVAVFSSPGSPQLARILAEAGKRGWRASLFLKGLPPRGGGRRLRAADLLFVPGARREHGAAKAPGERERAAFADAMARDLASYRHPPWKVSHAAET